MLAETLKEVYNCLTISVPFDGLVPLGAST